MNTLGTTVVEFDIVNLQVRHLTIDELDINPEDVSKVYWVHCNLTKPDALKAASKKLKLPASVKKLCLQIDPIPKVVDTDSSITIQIQCLLSTQIEFNSEVQFGNLILHLTNNYCFTASSKSIPALKEFAKTYEKNIPYAKTPCFILFLLLDNTISDYSKILFNEEVITDEMELGIRNLHENIYQEVMDIKQQVMKIKRHTISIREILMRISDRKMAVISEQCRSSLHNLANHSHMIIHEADSVRDVLNGMLAQIDNTLMQNMNETMRVLTAFAAIFLPLTLITGIYGMNFEWIPELHWKYGYLYAISLLIVCAIILLVLFKRKKWF